MALRIPCAYKFGHAKCIQSSKISHHDHVKSRQSANYKPSDNAYKDGWKFLEEKVKHMIVYGDDDINMLTMFEFIDDIRRLSLEYHFEEDITRALDKLLNNIDGQGID
ncbi:hypothetical protein TB1_023377 [Malus domestica]